MHWLFPLSSALSDVEPEHRFFLTMFLYRFGIDGCAQVSVKELSADFRLSDRVVSGSLNYLKGKGFLIQERVPSAGRPASTYICSKLLSDRIKEWLNLNEAPLHIERIDSLLADQKGVFWVQLRFAVRLLYLMLVTRSDEFGLVRNLGTSQLAEVTGITGTQVSSYLKLLKKVRLIRFVIPGFWSTYLYGQVNSVYQLHINGGFIFPPNYVPMNVTIKNYDVVKRIFALAKHICIDEASLFNEAGVAYSIPKFQLGDICRLDFLHIAPLLIRPSSQPAIGYMQFKIEEYANYLLNEQFQNIESPNFGDPLLISKIKEDCFPYRVGDGWIVDSNPSLPDILVNCLFRASLAIAREIAEYGRQGKRYRMVLTPGVSLKFLFLAES